MFTCEISSLGHTDQEQRFSFLSTCIPTKSHSWNRNKTDKRLSKSLLWLQYNSSWIRCMCPFGTFWKKTGFDFPLSLSFVSKSSRLPPTCLAVFLTTTTGGYQKHRTLPSLEGRKVEEEQCGLHQAGCEDQQTLLHRCVLAGMRLLREGFIWRADPNEEVTLPSTGLK